MKRVLIILAALISGAAVLPMAYARRPAVRTPSTHQLTFSITGEHEVFAAEIDGRRFSAIAALKHYLAEFPSGDRVECFLSLPGISPAWYVQTLKDYRKIERQLRDFCSKHKIAYEGGISSN